MFKKAMRNISRYKGHFIVIGILALIFSAVSCVALAIRETAAKAVDMGSSSQRFSTQSFSPFESLSRYAGIALLILLSVGVILFIVLTVLNVHKRRNEICTLNAIGMKRGKIALQFATETVAVLMAFAIIGTAVGYFISVPAASALLRYQMTSESQQIRNSGNWQQNGNQDNQGNGNTNGNQANNNQAYGDQANGNQTNSQTNSSQANAKQTADNQTNGNQANNNQANGNQAGGNNQGSGNSGWGNSGNGRNFGQGQRSSSSSSIRGFSASSPDIFVLLETLGIGLGFAILSSCAAAVAVSNCEPMKIMNPRRG